MALGLPDHVRACLFDLDGVLTQTAKVHAAAWKQMFDEYLRRRAEQRHEPFVPFDVHDDYDAYVDGKPRYEGVQSFLKSRGIDLPFGDPSDAPGDGSVCARDGTLRAVLRACASARVSNTWGARSRDCREAPSLSRMKALVVYREAVA